MRSVSKRQKAHDSDAVCSVTSFTARPLLRVGGKDKGTRFLSFVDAMLGFRHLLTSEDLNKASSLCTSMKGTLKSKFIVLSDDKVLPPPPNARGFYPGIRIRVCLLRILDQRRVPPGSQTLILGLQPQQIHPLAIDHFKLLIDLVRRNCLLVLCLSRSVLPRDEQRKTRP